MGTSTVYEWLNNRDGEWELEKVDTARATQFSEFSEEQWDYVKAEFEKFLETEELK